MDADDATLAAALRRHESGALAEVYRRYADVAYDRAVSILRDATLAESVVQEVLVRAWDEPDRYCADRGPLRGFLLSQIRGRAIDLMRAESARRNREHRAVQQSVAVAVDVAGDVVDKMQAATIRRALTRLTNLERAAIELAYFGGYSYREVAALLDAPEGTVKSRIRSGLMRLRSELTVDRATESVCQAA